MLCCQCFKKKLTTHIYHCCCSMSHICSQPALVTNEFLTLLIWTFCGDTCFPTFHTTVCLSHAVFGLGSKFKHCRRHLMMITMTHMSQTQTVFFVVLHCFCFCVRLKMMLMPVSHVVGMVISQESIVVNEIEKNALFTKSESR